MLNDDVSVVCGTAIGAGAELARGWARPRRAASGSDHSQRHAGDEMNAHGPQMDKTVGGGESLRAAKPA